MKDKAEKWIDDLSEEAKQKAEEAVEAHLSDGLFSPNYVEYDQYGQLATHCMRCGNVIAIREKETVRCPHCKKAIAMEKPVIKRLDLFRGIKMELEDGGYVEVMVCSECEPKMESLTEEEKNRIEGQILLAWVKELQFFNPPGKEEKIKRLKEVKLKRS